MENGGRENGLEKGGREERKGEEGGGERRGEGGKEEAGRGKGREGDNTVKLEVLGLLARAVPVTTQEQSTSGKN